MNMPPIYFECHVTLGPAIYGELELSEAVTRNGFVLSDMHKPGVTLKICTAKHKDYNRLYTRMLDLCVSLRALGYSVARRKIESIVLDERNPS